MSAIRIAGIGIPMAGGGYEMNFDEDDGWIWEEKPDGLYLHHDQFAPHGLRCVGFQYVVISSAPKKAPAVTAPTTRTKQSAA